MHITTKKGQEHMMPAVKKTHWFAKKPQNLNNRPQSSPNTQKKELMFMVGFLYFWLTQMRQQGNSAESAL